MFGRADRAKHNDSSMENRSCLVPAPSAAEPPQNQNRTKTEPNRPDVLPTIWLCRNKFPALFRGVRPCRNHLREKRSFGAVAFFAKSVSAPGRTGKWDEKVVLAWDLFFVSANGAYVSPPIIPSTGRGVAGRAERGGAGSLPAPISHWMTLIESSQP